MNEREALPFPSHPRFADRLAYARWWVDTFPNAPEWALVAAAGDLATYVKAVSNRG